MLRLRSLVYSRCRSTVGMNLMGIEVGGLFGLIVLVLNVWAIIKVIGSSAGTGAKVFWVVLILLLPILGVIIWFLFGPK